MELNLINSTESNSPALAIDIGINDRGASLGELVSIFLITILVIGLIVGNIVPRNHQENLPCQLAGSGE